ncbi:unnamed protein product, partial [Ectocarpus sp. 12 AP-2014]
AIGAAGTTAPVTMKTEPAVGHGAAAAPGAAGASPAAAPADGEQRLPPVSREFAEQMSPSALQAIKQISKLRDAQYLSGRGRDKPSASDEEQEPVLPM